MEFETINTIRSAQLAHDEARLHGERATILGAHPLLVRLIKLEGEIMATPKYREPCTNGKPVGTNDDKGKLIMLFGLTIVEDATLPYPWFRLR